MYVYLKIHSQGVSEVVAACDDSLFNKELCEQDFRLMISHDFYGGKLVDIDKALDIISKALNFNIIGDNIIKKAVEYGIIDKSCIKKINNVPMALKMVF